MNSPLTADITNLRLLKERGAELVLWKVPRERPWIPSDQKLVAILASIYSHFPDTIDDLTSNVRYGQIVSQAETPRAVYQIKRFYIIPKNLL